MKMKKYDYTLARILFKLTGIIFITQLLLEVSGIIVRKQGYEWVLPACGIALLLATAYAGILVLLNSRINT